MSLRIITADERLAADTKTTMAIFGPTGVGKTSLLKTLPPAETRLPRSRGRHEVGAGLARRQHPGAQLRGFARHRGADRRHQSGGRSERLVLAQRHYQHVAETYPDCVEA